MDSSDFFHSRDLTAVNELCLYLNVQLIRIIMIFVFVK